MKKHLKTTETYKYNKTQQTMAVAKRYQGRIYRIINDIDNQAYIGSTTQPLSVRMAQHRRSAKNGSQQQIYQHMREVGIEHFKILLIQHIDNCTKEQLRAIEHKFICEVDAVQNGLNSQYENQRCQHNRLRSQCKDCGGSQICEHRRQKSLCKECGGTSVCPHQRIRSQCKECGGASICPHQRIRSQCKECGGASICQHQRRRRACKICNPYLCGVCNKTYSGKSSYTRHCKTQRHLKNLEKQQ